MKKKLYSQDEINAGVEAARKSFAKAERNLTMWINRRTKLVEEETTVRVARLRTTLMEKWTGEDFTFLLSDPMESNKVKYQFLQEISGGLLFSGYWTDTKQISLKVSEYNVGSGATADTRKKVMQVIESFLPFIHYVEVEKGTFNEKVPLGQYRKRDVMAKDYENYNPVILINENNEAIAVSYSKNRLPYTTFGSLEFVIETLRTIQNII